MTQEQLRVYDRPVIPASEIDERHKRITPSEALRREVGQEALKDAAALAKQYDIRPPSREVKLDSRGVVLLEQDREEIKAGSSDARK